MLVVIVYDLNSWITVFLPGIGILNPIVLQGWQEDFNLR
jgi:hypothetical protein